MLPSLAVNINMMLPSRAVNSYYIVLHRLHNVWFQNNLGQVNICACISCYIHHNTHSNKHFAKDVFNYFDASYDKYLEMYG